MCLAITSHDGLKLGGGGWDGETKEGVKESRRCCLLTFTWLLGRLSCLVTRTKIYRFALWCFAYRSCLFLPPLALSCRVLPYRGGREGGREEGRRERVSAGSMYCTAWWTNEGMNERTNEWKRRILYLSTDLIQVYATTTTTNNIIILLLLLLHSEPIFIPISINPWVKIQLVNRSINTSGVCLDQLVVVGVQSVYS